MPVEKWIKYLRIFYEQLDQKLFLVNEEQNYEKKSFL